MPRTIPFAQYAYRRLSQLNCNSIHGVPGDFFLRALDHTKPAGVNWIGNASELCAGYAADGYARTATQIARHKSVSFAPTLGAVYTTYGVGELSAINAIAGSYAEMIPTVHIAAAPSSHAMLNGDARRPVHHALGNGDTEVYAEMAKRVTCAQALLHRSTSSTAAAEVFDHTLEQAILHSRPVYVTLPVDLVDQEVTADMLDKPLRTQPPTNDKESESNIVGNMFKKLRTAKSPLIVADGLSYPFQLQQRINELVTLTGIPAMSFTSGKGIVDETSPSWNPALPNTEAYSRNADLVLFFGPLLADTNTARWSAIPETKNTVYLNLDSVEMDDQVFTCRTASVLDALIHKLRQALPKDHLKRLNSTASPDSDPTPLVQNDSSIKQDDFWPAMSSFLRPHDTILLANGTPLIGGRSLRLPFNNQVIASSIWCSIGHMLPASQGVAAAKRDHGLPGRTILFEGDGSFQVTCQSISDIIRNRLDVTVIIVNNKGYTYERYLHGMTADYNDVPSWAYSEAAKFFGARENDPTYPVFGQQVSTWGHLIDTLESEAFSDGKGLKIIDVIMNPEDVPEKSKPGLANASEALRSF